MTGRFRLISAVFLCSASMAVSGGSIEGRVITDKGAAVPGYIVIIEGANERAIAITDGHGEFSAVGLPAGDYEAVPANRLGASQQFSLEGQPILKRWFGQDQSTVDIGAITIPHDWSAGDMDGPGVFRLEATE